MNRLIGHDTPVDGNAARVTSKESIQTARTWASFECPDLCKVSFSELRERTGTGQRDLTGLRSGCVVMIGLLEYQGSGKSWWVVRCDCGRYEPRRYRKWINKHLLDWKPNPDKPDQCGFCASGRHNMRDLNMS